MLVVGTGKTQTSPENNLNYIHVHVGTRTIYIHVHIYMYIVVAELYVCVYVHVYIVHVVAQLYGLCKGFSGSIVICLYTSVSEYGGTNVYGAKRYGKLSGVAVLISIARSSDVIYSVHALYSQHMLVGVIVWHSDLEVNEVPALRTRAA